MQSKIKISKETSYEKLSIEMSKLGAKLILDSLDLIEKDQVNFIAQNDSEATYAKKNK